MTLGAQAQWICISKSEMATGHQKRPKCVCLRGGGAMQHGEEGEHRGSWWGAAPGRSRCGEQATVFKVGASEAGDLGWGRLAASPDGPGMSGPQEPESKRAR